MSTPNRNGIAGPPAPAAQQPSHFRVALDEPLPNQAAPAHSPRGSRWGKSQQAPFRASLSAPLPTQASPARSPRGSRWGRGPQADG